MNQVCIDSGLGEPFAGEICPGIDSKKKSGYFRVGSSDSVQVKVLVGYDHNQPNHNTVRDTLVNFESYSACLNPVSDRSPGTEPPVTTAKPGTTPGGDPTSSCTMKTFWKCWWFWLIIALLIILVSLICHHL